VSDGIALGWSVGDDDGKLLGMALGKDDGA
jgi:hypothetical protein